MIYAARARAEEWIGRCIFCHGREAGQCVSCRRRTDDLTETLDAFAATQTADKDTEIARLTALVVQARDEAKAARADADTFREAVEMQRTQTAGKFVTDKVIEPQCLATGCEADVWRTRQCQWETQTAALRARVEELTQALHRDHDRANSPCPGKGCTTCALLAAVERARQGDQTIPKDAWHRGGAS